MRTQRHSAHAPKGNWINEAENAINRKKLKFALNNQLMRRCVCKLCGSMLDVLTITHCEKHGYSNKQDFINDGHIKYLDEWVDYGQRC